jgi:hypothetical protein
MKFDFVPEISGIHCLIALAVPDVIQKTSDAFRIDQDFSPIDFILIFPL